MFQRVTAAQVAFIVRECTGLICASMISERTEQLLLPQMVEKNTENHCMYLIFRISIKNEIF